MESISGIITKINYYNPENGYTVVILELDYKDKTIAMKKSKIVGNTIALVGYFDREPHEMEEYTFNGDFVKDHNYGLQFRFNRFERKAIKTEQGMISYLSSDMFPGIGPKIAKTIVEKLGLNCLTLIKENEDALKEIKEVKRARLTEYKNYRPNSEYHEGRGVWSVKCDVALPCATQNELFLEDAKQLVANGCIAVCEGANMPTTLDATKYLQENGVMFAPGKASNAGGVATSALEMSQNSERLSWTFEEVDSKLKNIMVNIYHNIDDAAKRYNKEGDYVTGANIAGFEKVLNAMLAQGVC